MYKIGELSKLCRIPVKTLRFYDSEGLLIPDKVDPFTGYRYYSASKLAQCYRIIALKALGFSLEEIKRHLEAGSKDEIIRLLAAKQAQMQAGKDRLETQLKQLKMMQRMVSEGKNNMMHIVIGGGDSFRAAASRKIYASKKEAMQEAENIKSALPAGICAGRQVIINYETEYRETGMDLAVCQEIAGNLPEKCGYEEKTLAFTDNTASLVCKAEELDEAYGAMIQYLYENAYQITGAAYEIYYEDGSAELKMPVCKRVVCRDEAVDEAAFENDPQALGKWQLIDIVPSREQFMYGSPKTPNLEDISLKELYFLEGGEGYWIIGGWTKGRLRVSAEFPTRHMVEEPYTLETLSGHTLLFHEVKSRYPDGTVDGAPQLWVYEKVSDDVLKARDIRIKDGTDYPFVNDEPVIGKWEVYDFYARDTECFEPDKQNRARERLFLRSVEFSKGGKCVYTYQSGSREFAWTKGLVLNRGAETASAYRIEKKGGGEYLLLEWKSGDYSFGGRINLYVLKRS